MADKVVFCETCHDYREYELTVSIGSRNIGGHDVSFSEKTAICVTCNSPVHVPGVRDANLKALERAYLFAVAN